LPVFGAVCACILLTTCGASSHRVASRSQATSDISLTDALIELDTLEMPDGVDPALFQQLKDEMSKQFSAKGVRKVTSTPPTGEANCVDDLELTDNGDSTFMLVWHYRNLGDYDQNGTAGISDITPLAIHYGEEVPEDDSVQRNSIQAVVDGSENDIVDIADITPIAMYYATDCAGYSIRGASSYPSNLDETTEVSTVEFARADGENRKCFNERFPVTGHRFMAVASYDSVGELSELSNVVELVPANEAPIAMIAADVTEGEIPLFVSFSPAGSYDPDGSILAYRWDANGDGTYEGTTSEPSAFEYTYLTAGIYCATLVVQDDKGLAAATTLGITVSDPSNDLPVVSLRARIAAPNSDPEWKYAQIDGFAPLDVDFDAQHSYDPDGEITKYEWDLNGAAEGWNWDEGSSITYHNFSQSGVFESCVRLTDDKGATVVDSIIVNAKLGVDSTEWIHTWGGVLEDDAEDVAVDAAGNVYVAGQSMSPAGDRDIFILKFLPSGSLAWAKTWDYGYREFASSVAVNSEGDIYVVGYTIKVTGSLQSAGTDLLVLKYDPSGNLLWVRSWDADSKEYAYGLAIANDGCLLICGNISNYQGDSYVYFPFLIKLSSGGELLWARKYEDAENPILYFLRKPAATNDNTFVLGFYRGEYAPKGRTLLKLTPEGDVSWAYKLNIHELEGITDICVDSTGYLYATGSSGDYGGYGFLAKVSSSGTLQWANEWAIDEGDSQHARIAISAEGVFISCWDFSTDSEGRITLSSFGLDGSLRWTNVFSRNDDAEVHAYALTTDSLDHVYIAGTSPDNLGYLRPKWNYALPSEASLSERQIISSDISHLGMKEETGEEGDFEGVLDFGGGGNDALVVGVRVQ